MPTSVVLIALFVLPVALVVRYSANQFVPGQLMHDALTPQNYVRFFTDGFFQRVFATTIVLSLLSSALAAIPSVPTAYVLRRVSPAWRSLLITVLLFPLLIVTVVRAAGWVAIFDDRGVLNSALLASHLVSHPIRFLYTAPALVCAMASALLPYMILSIDSVLQSVPRALEEASMDLGARPLATFRYVILPLIMPGIVTGLVLSFILSMDAYAAPLLIGGDAVRMMTPMIYVQISQLQNWPFASAMSIVLIVTSMVLSWLISRLFGRRAWLNDRPA